LFSGGLRYAATTGYFLAALQADSRINPNGSRSAGLRIKANSRAHQRGRVCFTYSCARSLQ